MIHRPSRKRLALALRRYVACRISNDDLDEVLVDWRDRGAIAVQGMAWQLYDDMYTHRATGKHALSRESRRCIARWILFLQSDTEYFWPEYSFYRIAVSPLTNLLTLGYWRRKEEQRWREFLEAGDFDVWPFITKVEFESAVARPRYLYGNG